MIEIRGIKLTTIIKIISSEPLYLYFQKYVFTKPLNPEQGVTQG